MTTWSVDVTDGVMVWRFPDGMNQEEFGQSAYERFTELLDEHDVHGMVTEVEITDAFSAETFEVWERSGREAAAAGVERWAVVAEGIKSLSLKSQVSVADLDIYTTEEFDEAMAWVDG
ncbi:hypothetical protein VB773_05060 [Haloarculaceae archaeon H-GB2-1]|nr:hypothetical protein [Haloarculaceae archaeon H-GB1-1]MEA5388951.1 hypothetical protein [Haloarculaceae archaeon H-GB11]MEA5407007.1 hypothetical protein [Haloarculaceae archaeon H-GB2-1]